MVKRSTLALTVATIGGVGRLPKAPGTWGSAVACLLYLPLFAAFGTAGIAVAVLVVLAAGIWAMASLERMTGRHDPQEAVIDEVAGQWLALLPAAGDALAVLVGFLAFRLFDIWKPWPARNLDRGKIPGWSGMLDDLVAGIYAALLVLAWRLI